MSNNFRVCIQNLNAYNNGQLVNEWVNVDSDEIDAAVTRILAAGGGEEWEIADTEGFPLPVPSSAQVSDLVSWAAALDRTHLDLDAVAAYCAHHGFTLTDNARDVLSEATETYAGEFRNAEDFAQETWGQCVTIPKELEYYIDWEKAARDLLINDYFEEGNHYFRRA